MVSIPPDLRPYPALPSHFLLKVDKFGFSANNITYQALGEDFHPAPASDNGNASPETQGLVPVWGFGTIIASTHPKIKEDERVYGYISSTPSGLGCKKFSFYVPRPHLPAGELFNFVRNLFLGGKAISFSTQQRSAESNPHSWNRQIRSYLFRPLRPHPSQSRNQRRSTLLRLRSILCVSKYRHWLNAFLVFGKASCQIIESVA